MARLNGTELKRNERTGEITKWNEWQMAHCMRDLLSKDELCYSTTVDRLPKRNSGSPQVLRDRHDTHVVIALGQQFGLQLEIWSGCAVSGRSKFLNRALIIWNATTGSSEWCREALGRAESRRQVDSGGANQVNRNTAAAALDFRDC